MPTLVTPPSETHALTANQPALVGAHNTPLTVHIPAGVTCDVAATCDPAVANGAAVDWVDLSGGAKVGPAFVLVQGPCAAIKLLSVAGGTVNVSRTRLQVV